MFYSKCCRVCGPYSLSSNYSASMQRKLPDPNIPILIFCFENRIYVFFSCTDGCLELEVTHPQPRTMWRVLANGQWANVIGTSSRKYMQKERISSFLWAAIWMKYLEFQQQLFWTRKSPLGWNYIWWSRKKKVKFFKPWSSKVSYT